MVDNFERIRPLLRFDNEGDCYYVQLLRRAADDPKPNGSPDPKYHGNMNSRSIKDYFICSLDHLNDVEDEIKSLCTMFNVRAYIRLNRRSYKKIALQMLKHIAEQVSSGESFSSPHHLVASAAGTVHNEPSKTWIVDLDKEYLGYEGPIKSFICNCDPIRKKVQDTLDDLSDIASYASSFESYISKNMVVLPTKSGKHIIVQPFNVQQFSEQWGEFCTKFDIALKQPDIHKDNPTILYVP